MAWIDPSGNQPAQIKDFEGIFVQIVSLVTGFAILVAFVMLILGGFKYMTSGGDPKATQSAQQTLTYAIFGIILLFIVWLILKFISDFTGIDVTQFKIGP